jgi:hypothetical protein
MRSRVRTRTHGSVGGRRRCVGATYPVKSAERSEGGWGIVILGTVLHEIHHTPSSPAANATVATPPGRATH